MVEMENVNKSELGLIEAPGRVPGGFDEAWEPKAKVG